MACKTCDHTMQQASTDFPAHEYDDEPHIAAGKVWWCPRCGSILERHNHDEPRIVSRAFITCEAIADLLAGVALDSDITEKLEAAERNLRECVESISGGES